MGVVCSSQIFPTGRAVRNGRPLFLWTIFVHITLPTYQPGTIFINTLVLLAVQIMDRKQQNRPKTLSPVHDLDRYKHWVLFRTTVYHHRHATESDGKGLGGAIREELAVKLS